MWSRLTQEAAVVGEYSSLPTVPFLPYGIVLSRTRRRTGTHRERGLTPWGGSRRVVALKKTTVESRPVSRVGPSGGRETF